jgi:hypothetical protein
MRLIWGYCRERPRQMSELAFLSAVLALLLAPGPTNTLMALAGAQAGFGLLPVELLGYLTTILPLTWLGAPLLARWPVLATGLKVLAAAWVLWLRCGCGVVWGLGVVLLRGRGFM